MNVERFLDRYDRQIRLFGVEGQEKIAESKVFIAGAGGLGSPISFYLAAAGVGKIVIADDDEVEISNLNRQILHWERDIGKKKAVSAKEKLTEMNSEIVVETMAETISEENVSRLIGDADLVIDAVDNFPVRYLLNETAIKKRIPFIHGAISGFHGQATTVIPGESACLRCIFPQPPPPAPSPVVGTTPGIIGLVQATEAIKYITGTGELLSGRLLIWDGLLPSLETIEVSRDPRCPDCAGPGQIIPPRIDR
ncbi:HesA/MoeB/ThiF family protein [Methanotrichaceae archaeon M04Ac]|jgi:adenylyltransferase/sulfurtransferase|uniref:HesA/MoeB/ThiF family protein n=1 Tax=Candidatus Methanocrinis alkalitolerans TaxID=3033395 RepID=A0ABT5XHA3_9EURY|nr:HesA/MoeB/ThiF family protein [Candidatus Methanocrinis alkalitolerans]MDF0594047.1 HesA/MoeB/ThiF family protein [Candidatus Methanocrinis alkalitolerans]